jgi:hypothetical protein
MLNVIVLIFTIYLLVFGMLNIVMLSVVRLNVINAECRGALG